MVEPKCQCQFQGAAGQEQLDEESELCIKRQGNEAWNLHICNVSALYIC
jgi:hypothetical protein